LYLTLHGDGAEMGARGGLMVAAHGRGRLLEVVGGSGWPSVAQNTARKWPRCAAA